MAAALSAAAYLVTRAVRDERPAPRLPRTDAPGLTVVLAEPPGGRGYDLSHDDDTEPEPEPEPDDGDEVDDGAELEAAALDDRIEGSVWEPREGWYGESVDDEWGVGDAVFFDEDEDPAVMELAELLGGEPGDADAAPQGAATASAPCGGSLPCLFAATAGRGPLPDLPAALQVAYDQARADFRAGHFQDAARRFGDVAAAVTPSPSASPRSPAAIDRRFVCSQALLASLLGGAGAGPPAPCDPQLDASPPPPPPSIPITARPHPDPASDAPTFDPHHD